MGARSEYPPDQRDRNAAQRDGDAELRDIDADERDQLAEVRDHGAAGREGVLRSEISAIRELLRDAEARAKPLDDWLSGGGAQGNGSEQTAVDLAVTLADLRLTAIQIRDCLERMDESVDSAAHDRRLTWRDREAALVDRCSAADDRFESLCDRHQAAIERAQLPDQRAPGAE